MSYGFVIACRFVTKTYRFVNAIRAPVSYWGELPALGSTVSYGHGALLSINEFSVQAWRCGVLISRLLSAQTTCCTSSLVATDFKYINDHFMLLLVTSNVRNHSVMSVNMLKNAWLFFHLHENCPDQLRRIALCDGHTKHTNYLNVTDVIKLRLTIWNNSSVLAFIAMLVW